MVIDLNKCPCCYWSDKEKLSFLQRRIIVYSMIYYDYDKSVINDCDYDNIVLMYLRLIETIDKSIIIKTRYYKSFRDFDGSTGMHLSSRLSHDEYKHVDLIAQNVIFEYEKEK